jgi:hypothetical protein
LLDDIFLYDGDRCIDAQDVRRLAHFGMSRAEEKFFAYHVDECRKCRQFESDFNKTVFQRGETIEFEAHKTNALTKVMLMSHAVMTHFMNSGNGRCLELDFSQNGNQVAAMLPDDSLRLMPGWYMLFGMVDDIPSVAQIVKIEAGKFVSATGEAPAEMKTFQVFPNPVTVGGSFSVEIRSNRTGEVNFELTDATGKAIQRFSFSEKTTENQVFTLKTTKVPAGVYFLTARLGTEIMGTGKVMLKN